MSDFAEILDSRAARLSLKIAGAVVAAGVLVTAGWLWMRTADAHGQAALAAAAELVQQADGPQATPDARQQAIASLQQILAEHGRTSAAPVAAYQLGNLQYQAGDYAAARGAYELALAKGASGSVRTLAASGIGYTWEAQKNYANAVTAYETLVGQEGPKQFFFEEALLDLARAQALAGKPADAIATYERLLKDVPDTRRAPDVRAKIADLQGKRS
jgi:tetratricopeptide (TPR) repeat protein